MPRPFLRVRDRRPASLAPLVLLLAPVLFAGPASADWPGDPAANVPICTASGLQFSPELASDGFGGAFIAWADQRAGVPDVYDIYVQHVLSNGAVDPGWPVNGVALCTAQGNQGNQKLVSDGAGGAFVVWQDLRSGTADIYAHHVLASGVDPAWPLNGLVVCAAEKNQFLPEVTTDGSHGAIVTWWDYRRGSEYDIYSHHLLPGGLVDPAWPVDGLAVCTAAGDQRYPRLVPDGAGGAITAWMDFRGGPEADIYAQHIRADGTVDPGWPGSGVALCTASGSQSLPVLATDASGGALVAWYDYRAGAIPDIYAARVLASGAADPSWPAGGRALCAAAGEQSAPAIVATGPGDAIVTWMDKRSGVYYDIYAQRASGPDGGAWLVDGVPVATGFADKRNPRIAADGLGGAIVTWYGTRVSGWDIHAQHVLASGVLDPLWPLGGSAVCTATGTQQEPRILADGSGGAIVSWIDHRAGGGTPDIYAQRVQADGQLGGTVVDVPAAAGLDFSLEPIHPNPSRGGPLSVRFSLAHEAPVTLEWLDVAGRRIVVREAGTLSEGRHTVVLGAPGRVPAGLYFIRLSAGGSARTTRVALF